MFIDFKDARKVASHWKSLMPIMTCEELGELIQAISKYERASQTNSDNLPGCKLDLEDDLADVIISITALGELYHVSWDRVDDKMKENLQ